MKKKRDPAFERLQRRVRALERGFEELNESLEKLWRREHGEQAQEPEDVGGGEEEGASRGEA